MVAFGLLLSDKLAADLLEVGAQVPQATLLDAFVDNQYIGHTAVRLRLPSVFVLAMSIDLRL